MDLHTCQKILTTAALLLEIAGAWVLMKAVVLTESEARELATPRYDEHPAQKADRLKQSRNAKIGFALLAGGFALQAVAVWLS